MSDDYVGAAKAMRKQYGEKASFFIKSFIADCNRSGDIGMSAYWGNVLNVYESLYKK